jgi:hypothetical protein
VDTVQSYFSSAKISFVVSGKPQIKIESLEKDYYIAIERLFLDYFSFLEAQNLQAVIAIDEFQKIVCLIDAEKIEVLLRTIANKRKNSTFVFIGSKRNILLGMFNNSARAFFKLGTEFELPPINHNEFYLWVRERFNKKSIQLDFTAFESLYKQADGETRFIQQICHEAFRTLKSGSILSIIELTNIVNQVIIKKTYNAQLLNRYTSVQQNTLKIIAVKNGYKIYSSKTLIENSISKASAQSAVKALRRDGIVFQELDGKLSFEDIEFKLWLTYVTYVR